MARKYNVEMILNAVDNASPKLRKVGVAFTAMGAATSIAAYKAIKAASDYEETASKFSVVFGSIEGQADSLASNLAKNFGLSSMAAKKLLGNTGDLLTGFGFTQESALDLSDKVNKLAVDLASFTNYSGGAEGASQALTKALLGEAESAKQLGIVINQNTKEYQETVKRIMETKNVSLMQAKALTTLEIATKQSKNAIGDFARTNQSFANQMRIVKARLQDLVVSLGSVLLPIAKQAINTISSLINSLFEWQKNNAALFSIVVKFTAALGAMLAILGPILLILPQLAAGFSMALVAINPLTLAIVAATTAIGAITLKITEWKAALDDANESLEDASGKQKELSNIVKSGVNVWKEYGDKSKEAIMEQGISLEEAKAAMRGMFSLSTKLQGEDKQRWIERANLYKEIYNELKEKHIETEDIKTESTVTGEETRDALIKTKFQEQLAAQNLDLQNFIKNNQIKNKELIKYLKNEQKLYEQNEQAKVTATEKANKALEKLGIKKAEAFRDTLSFMAGAADSNNKALVAMGKSAAIAQATINTYQAATKALAQGGIFGAVLMGGVIATGLAQVAKIAGVTLEKGGYVEKTGLAVVHEGEMYSGANNEMGFGKKMVFNITGNTFAGTGGMEELVDMIKDGIYGDIKLEKSFT